MGRADRRPRTTPLVFGQPVVSEAAIDEVVDTLRSGWLGRGPKTVRFEAEFASAVGALHARATNSGYSALWLALKVAGIGPGDEVITTPLTFAATANAIVNVGATPVFVDVDRATQNIDPARVTAAVTDRTRAILPVHMCGLPCAMDDLQAVADEHGLLVVEDAAHAVGAEYHGRRVGSLSDLTAFSFQASKNLTTGEGGMLTTANQGWAEQAGVLAVHGMSLDAWRQYSSEAPHPPVAVAAGAKLTMSDVQASLGLHELAALVAARAGRSEVWSRYQAELGDLPLMLPADAPSGVVHARHLFTVMLDLDRIGRSRDDVRAELRALGIGTGVHYVPLHVHEYYASTLPYGPGAFPDAEWIGARTMSLPLHQQLTDDDLADVVSALRTVLS